MNDSFDLQIVPLILTAPGLIILAWACVSLFAWTFRLEANLPFERASSDETRLVRAGLDLAYGVVPLAIGFFIQASTFGRHLLIPTGLLLCAVGFALIYPLAYYLLIRPYATTLRIERRHRRPRGVRPGPEAGR